MPECNECGNRRAFTKENVVSYTVMYDEEYGEVEWESDEYEFLGPPDDDYLACAECESRNVSMN